MRRAQILYITTDKYNLLLQLIKNVFLHLSSSVSLYFLLTNMAMHDIIYKIPGTILVARNLRKLFK